MISIEGQSPPPLRGGSWGRRVPVAALEDSLATGYFPIAPPGQRESRLRDSRSKSHPFEAVLIE